MRTTMLLLALISTGCVIDTRTDGGAEGGGGSSSTGGGAGSTGGGIATGGGTGSTGGGIATGGGTGSTGGGVATGGGAATGGGTTNQLAAPTLQEANAGNASVELDWSSVSGAFNYDVLSGTDATSLTVARTTNSISGTTITGLTNGTTYFFAIIAKGAGLDSAPSNVLSATPRAPALDVIGTTPDAGATNVPRDVTLELRFSAGVQASSTMLSITPDVPLTWDWNGSYSRLELSAQSGTFAANTTYTLTLQDARSNSGLQLRAPYALTFTTGALPLSRDETVPQVTGISPMNGATDVILNPYLTVSFNKPMTWASVSNALSLTPDAGVSGCAQQMNSTQFRCGTGPLARGTTYTVHVGTTATSFDDAGLTLPTAFTSTFSTLPLDTTRPTVVSFTPTAGAQGQDRTPQVSITFSEPMDCAAVRAAFSFVSPARTLSSLGSCTGTNTSFTFHPSSAFAYGETVSWTLGTGAVDASGNALATATSSSFRIARVATQTLQAVAALEGTVNDGGVIDTTSATLKVGMRPGNVEQRGFLTFDFSQLPANTVGISGATLNVTQVGTTGTPFNKFSNVGAYGLDYGSSLDATDYAKPHDTHLDSIVIPVPPFIIPTLMPDYTSVSAAASALPVTRSVDVSQQAGRQWSERAQRMNRMQLRLSFAGINAADGGTNATGTHDEVRFNSSKAVLDKPTLVVDYEYP